jgi:predicted mannosyl-3-phosphoglycerate phosphatase (HAD superfamily)
METKPLFDRSDFATVVRSAEANRVEFFKTATRRIWSTTSGAATSLRSSVRVFFLQARPIDSTSVDKPLATTLTGSGI